MSKYIKTLIVAVVVLLALAFFVSSSKKGDAPKLGGLIHTLQEDFAAGIRVNNVEVINKNGVYTGAVTGSVTTTTGDITLTNGRLVTSATGSTQDCVTNAVTINLATKTEGRVVVDQAAAAACAITLAGGTAGEFVVIDAIYGGDTAWTLASGGAYIGNTFSEAACIGFQSTAVDNDHLVIYGQMIDADTISVLSCYYNDQ